MLPPIQPPTRRCTVTGRDLRPGERYFAALVERGTEWLRKDYSVEAWTGPPEGSISHWMGKLPELANPGKLAFDDDLLMDCFHRLDGHLEENQVKFRYVLALLLIRRKKLRLLETTHRASEEVIVVQELQGGRIHHVVNPRLGDAELREVQDEVFSVLGWR